MGCCSLFQGDLPNPEIEPRSPTLQVDSLPAEPAGKPIHMTGCKIRHLLRPGRINSWWRRLKSFSNAERNLLKSWSSHKSKPPSRQGLSHAHNLFFPSRSDFSSLGTGHWRAGLWVSGGHAWISHNFSELEKKESNKAVYKKPRKASVMTQGYTRVQLVFKTTNLMGLSLNISRTWRLTGDTLDT